MVTATDHFSDVARAVIHRTAELLSSRVSVTDERGVVVASSDPRCIGLPVHLADETGHVEYARVPLRVAGQSGEVVLSEPAHGESVPPRLAEALVELMINQTAVLERLPNQHQVKNKFIHDLLHEPVADESAVLREGQILGMDLTRPRAVVLIDASDYILAPTSTALGEASEDRARRRAQLVIASIVGFFDLPDDTICAYIGAGEVAVLKASSSQDLAAWTDRTDGREQSSVSWANLTALKRAGGALVSRLRHDTHAAVTVGIGRYHPGTRGLAASYQDARVALSLGRRFHGQNKVHCLDGLGIAAFVGVADEATKIGLAMHLLSPLDQEPELLDSLDAYFVEDCCPSSTAKRLAIHRNTLGYRLDKIASLTGLDPRRFDSAVQIRLALLLRSLDKSTA